MKSFAVRLAIDTPIALDSLLHLDGLLCALTARAGNHWNEIPLAQTDGIWHGSAALLECGPFGPAYSQVVRLKHVRVDSVPRPAAEALPARDRRIRDMSRERNRLTPHTLLAGIRAVWFVGRGNPDRVKELLATARNLGSMGQTGYGRIREQEAIEVPDVVTSGLVHTPAFPARNLPLDLWKKIGRDDQARGIVSMQRPLPPYWHGPEVECISPMQVDLTGTAAELAEIVGASFIGN
jgi:hypothetical protein